VFLFGSGGSCLSSGFMVLGRIAAYVHDITTPFDFERSDFERSMHGQLRPLTTVRA
jgi:hypothetical protein